MIFSLSFPALVRPFRCTRSPNGIAKVLLFFYSANFFEVFLKFLLPDPHIPPPGPPEARPSSVFRDVFHGVFHGTDAGQNCFTCPEQMTPEQIGRKGE